MSSLLDRLENPLNVALALSLLVHAVVITGVGFIAPRPHATHDKTSALEVVLVNAKTKEAPVKADALAQSNLDRGGNTDAERRIKSPLPVPKSQPRVKAEKVALEARQSKADAAATKAEAPQKQVRAAAPQKPVQEVMTAPQSTQAVDSDPVQPAAAVEPDRGALTETPTTLDTADLVARSLDAVRLQAELARNMDAYQKRPKRKFIGSRVREYRFASYVEAWRQKVEKVGNLNYPEAAKAMKLYGTLQLTVSIRADGSVEKVELNRSSGSKVLDEAAQRIVALAAPYASFPDDIRRDTDIIEITRTWTFTREDTLFSGE